MTYTRDTFFSITVGTNVYEMSIEVLDTTSNSAEVNISISESQVTPTPTDTGFIAPNSTIIQWAITGTDGWNDGRRIDFDGEALNGTYRVSRLEPDTSYIFRVIPAVDYGEVIYFGTPSSPTSPVQTDIHTC